MARFRAILREPLVHFLALGAGLFLLYGLFGQEAGERSDRIVVTEAQIEGLAALFERTWRRPPTAAELDGLIADHIKEEILYREALALGLERDDLVIRRRLRQKMEFVSEDFADQAEPTEDELRAFLTEQPDRFRIPDRISFVQVYLSPDRRGEAARGDAERLLVALNAGASEPAEAGDPFLLEQDHRNITTYEVERLFGRAFAARLAELPLGRWSGPVESGYGLHLVLVRERIEGALPDLDQVRDAVAREWQAARRQEASDALYEKLRAGYDVTIERPGAAAERPAKVAEHQ
jgi:hypothetical protein